MQIRELKRIPMLFAVFFATLSMAAETPSPDSAPMQAVWKDAQIDFIYIGRTSFYSCDSLKYKVTRILMDVGAREDLKVRVNGCSSIFVPERFTSVRINVAIPVVLAAAEGIAPDEKTRLELIAKVRGEAVPDFETVEQFPASRKRVRFSRMSKFLDDGDCELVEQLQTRVFTKLDIRIIKENNWCIPGQINFGQLNLEVETLVALPKPDDA